MGILNPFWLVYNSRKEKNSCASTTKKSKETLWICFWICEWVLMPCLKCMAKPLCQEGENTWVSCTTACSLQTHTSVLPETRSYISFFVLYYVYLTKRKFRVRLWGLFFFPPVCASWSKPDPDTCMNSADCSHSDILLTLCNLCCLCNN